MEIDISPPEISIAFSGIRGTHNAVDVLGGEISISINWLHESHKRDSSPQNSAPREEAKNRNKQQSPCSPKPDPKSYRNPSNPRLMELMELI